MTSGATPVGMAADGDVLVVTIDNPPVNASSQAVRLGIMEAIAHLAADPRFRAAVIVGAGKTFIAGSDLREFDGPIPEPQLPEVIAAIESCPKPVVAAIHGAALGGGFELALGCDARIIEGKAVVGLPEVTLGLIPGAGGTQRLPRLVGIPAAIDLIVNGTRLKAEHALGLGIVDAIAAGDLLAAALDHARRLGTGKRRVIDRPVPTATAADMDAAEAAALEAGKRRPAVIAAIAAVRDTSRLTAADGLRREREAFNRLRHGKDAKALMHLFFAERAAPKVPQLDGVSPLPVHIVGIVGAGTMGTSIAIAMLDAGFETRLMDADTAVLTRARERVAAHYSRAAAAGKLEAAQRGERLARLTTASAYADLAAADLIVEAVFEDLDVKRDVFAALDRCAASHAVLATNTSYLDIDTIAAATARPNAVIGLHFFSPANVMRLVEVVRGRLSGDAALRTGFEIARAMRKTAILAGNARGFVGNRIYAAYRRECEFMLEDGASAEEIDTALESFGFAMGPFAVADLSGLDVAWRMRKAQAARRNPACRYVEIPDRLCERGFFGQKTQAGYYRYDGRQRLHNPEAEQIAAECRRAKGIVPRPLPRDEIVLRALCAMVRAGSQVLADSVARQPGDIDVAMVRGYGFPSWEGGPLFWSEHMDPMDRVRGFDLLSKAHAAADNT